MKLILAQILFITFATLSVSPVLAAGSSNGGYGNVSCNPTYGGGNTCTTGTININKTVQNPKTGAYVDNLTVNDPKYAPNTPVNFQITITNNTNGVISSPIVKDIFPQFITYRSGAGAYDSAKNTLTFQTTDMKPNESRTFTVSGTIADTATLPTNQAGTCVTNTAQVTTAQMKSEDTASLCIEHITPTTPSTNTGITPTITKGGIATVPGTSQTTTKGGLNIFPSPATKKSPATGPELMYLVVSIPAALFGQFLRKKAIA